MAGWDIEVRLPLRPCKIGERDAIFHGWFPTAKPIEPPPYLVGILEDSSLRSSVLWNGTMEPFTRPILTK